MLSISSYFLSAKDCEGNRYNFPQTREEQIHLVTSPLSNLFSAIVSNFLIIASLLSLLSKPNKGCKSPWNFRIPRRVNCTLYLKLTKNPQSTKPVTLKRNFIKLTLLFCCCSRNSELGAQLGMSHPPNSNSTACT